MLPPLVLCPLTLTPLVLPPPETLVVIVVLVPDKLRLVVSAPLLRDRDILCQKDGKHTDKGRTNISTRPSTRKSTKQGRGYILA